MDGRAGGDMAAIASGQPPDLRLAFGLGLPELAAKNAQDYARISVELAHDGDRRMALRRTHILMWALAVLEYCRIVRQDEEDPACRHQSCEEILG